MQNRQALRQAVTSGSLWFPTHFQHDAETDDTLCWLLLERLSRMLHQPSPKILVQLPAGKEFHSIAQHMRSKGVTVFLDADSHNAKAVLENLNYVT